MPNTPLGLAIRHKHINAIYLLLDNGSNEVTGGDLAICLWMSNTTLINRLLEKCSIVELEDYHLSHILNMLANRYPIHLFKMMLDHTSIKHIYTIISSLHYVAHKGYIDHIKVILEHGIDINVLDREMRSALHIAVMSIQINTVKYLMEQGADTSIKNMNKQTPIDVAIHMYSTTHKNDYLVISRLLCRSEEGEQCMMDTVNMFIDYITDNSLADGSKG
jgi:ankyrin repeat protein